MLLKIRFSVLLVVTSCSNEEQDFIVGQGSKNIEDIALEKLYDLVGNKEQVVTTNYLKQKWESEFNDEFSLIKTRFNTFEVLESTSEDTGMPVYFLKAVSKDKMVETGVFLRNNKNNSYTIY